MKNSILKISGLILLIATSISIYSCNTPVESSWGKDVPCTRITGENMNSISTLGNTPVNAGQITYMKATTKDYFVVSFNADAGNCKVEISINNEILYSGNDMTGTLGNSNRFIVNIEKSGTYKVFVDTEDFLGTVIVEKRSK